LKNTPLIGNELLSLSDDDAVAFLPEGQYSFS